MKDYYYTLKILLVGDPSTRKDISKYFFNLFKKSQKLTIGVNFYSKTTFYKDKKIKLQLWEPSGEERFKFLFHQYCKEADGALILYNIAETNTLKSIPTWVQSIREHAGDIPIILVGNRLNLEEPTEVSKEEGINIAKKHELSAFCEISSRTGHNIEELFNVLTELAVDYYEANKLENEIV